MAFIGKQIRVDLEGRMACYMDDWRDACSGGLAMMAPTVYIFLASVLPALAFGQQLDDKTKGQIGVAQVLVVTAFAGVMQSIFGGQPLLIIGVAEPIVVIWGFMYKIVRDDTDLGVAMFMPFCTWVCLWTGILCMIVALLGATRLISYFTLFAGELFGSLIAILFMQQAIYGTIEEFSKTDNGSVNGMWAVFTGLGLPITIFYFQRLKSTRLFSPFWRGAAEYAPIIMVVVWSALAFLLTKDIAGLPKRVHSEQPWDVNTWDAANKMGDLPTKGVLVALVPAAVITVLFYFDHTVSSQLAQTGDDVRLERPEAYAWDLFLLGILTIIAGMLGLPPINGVLPQAPMHSRALRGIKHQQKLDSAAEADVAEADVTGETADGAPSVNVGLRESSGRGEGAKETSGSGMLKKFKSADRNGDGSLTRDEFIAVHGNADKFDAMDTDQSGTVEVGEYLSGELDVLEQRGSNLIQALLVGVCALCAPAIRQIPASVLWGYFAFMALESIPDMQISNRIVLMFIEESARKDHLEGKPYAEVPHSVVVQFTLLQVFLLAGIWALIVFGGIAGLAFPIPILFLLPLRSHLLPWYFGADNIKMLDEAEYEAVTPAAVAPTPEEQPDETTGVDQIPELDATPAPSESMGCCEAR